MDYKEQLKDIRWKIKRLRTIYFAGKKCQMCSYPNFLQVHHKKYVKGLYAWEYDVNDLIVLCKSCHYKVHRPVLNDKKYDKMHIGYIIKNNLILNK